MMKKRLITLLLFSSSTFADQHFYVGMNALLGNKTVLEETGVTSASASNDASFSIFGGLTQKVYPFIEFGVDVGLGLELEYQNYGEANFTNILGSPYSWAMDGHAFYVNSRPVFSLKDANYSNYYLALIAGIGYQEVEFTNPMFPKIEESGAVYQIGAELGYMLKNFDLSAGYRYQISDLDGTDTKIKGLILGVKYKF